MAAPKFVDVVDSLTGATLSVPEDQIERFEAAGFRRPGSRKPTPKKSAGAKSDSVTSESGRDQ